MENIEFVAIATAENEKTSERTQQPETIITDLNWSKFSCTCLLKEKKNPN